MVFSRRVALHAFGALGSVLAAVCYTVKIVNMRPQRSRSALLSFGCGVCGLLLGWDTGGLQVPLAVAQGRSAADSGICSTSGGFWRRTKSAERRQACVRLVRALARLESQPAEALSLAREARSLLDAEESRERTAALWVQGRALLLEGDARSALESLRRAEQELPQKMPALFLWSYARAAQLTGERALALQGYRRLVLAGEADDASFERARIFIEAAFSVMQVQTKEFAEARAFAREAEKVAAPLLADFARAVRVLVALRSGELEQAEELARAIQDVDGLEWLLQRGPVPSLKRREFFPILPPGEREALLAAVEDARGGRAAGLAWQQYLDSAGEESPEHLREWARDRLTRISQNR